MLRELSTRVVDERQTGVTAVNLSGTQLRNSLTTNSEGPDSTELFVTGELRWTDAQYAHAAVLLDRIAQFAGVSAANVAEMDGRHVPAPAPIPEAEEPTEQCSLLVPL